MIDRIIFKSIYEIVIVFTEGKPFTIKSDAGNAFEHLQEVLLLDQSKPAKKKAA